MLCVLRSNMAGQINKLPDGIKTGFKNCSSPASSVKFETINFAIYKRADILKSCSYTKEN